MVDDLVKQVE